MRYWLFFVAAGRVASTGRHTDHYRAMLNKKTAENLDVLSARFVPSAKSIKKQAAQMDGLPINTG
jgi:hypothetical protein